MFDRCAGVSMSGIVFVMSVPDVTFLSSLGRPIVRTRKHQYDSLQELDDKVMHKHTQIFGH